MLAMVFANFKHQSVPVSGQLATLTNFILCETRDSVLRVALLHCKQIQGVSIGARNPQFSSLTGTKTVV